MLYFCPSFMGENGSAALVSDVTMSMRWKWKQWVEAPKPQQSEADQPNQHPVIAEITEFYRTLVITMAVHWADAIWDGLLILIFIGVRENLKAMSRRKLWVRESKELKGELKKMWNITTDQVCFWISASRFVMTFPFDSQRL